MVKNPQISIFLTEEKHHGTIYCNSDQDRQCGLGVPLIVLIMGTGILLTVRLPAVQFRKLGKALKYMVKNEDDGIGEVSSFRRFVHRSCCHHRNGKYRRRGDCRNGRGPGAIFWMVLAACLGMATKYSEGLLPSSSGKTEAEADS